jgi:hypothetical protein
MMIGQYVKGSGRGLILKSYPGVLQHCVPTVTSANRVSVEFSNSDLASWGFVSS